MIDLREDPLIKKFLRNRELQKSTETRYLGNLKLYCKFIDKTPTEFIDEADFEEDSRIRLRNRKVGNYLLDFREWLNNNNYSEHTKATAMMVVKSLYNEFSIELPKLRFKKNLPVEDISDIPTKDDIRLALSYANLKYKAIFLLMTSSGMRASDIRALKYSDLLKSLEGYIKLPNKDILNVDVLINTLEESSNELIVPTWKFIAQKTNTPTITFCTPEALQAILIYLKTEPPKNIDEPLFHSNLYKNQKIGRHGITQYFQRINRKCEFKSRGPLGFFRSHKLRKFFATTLYRKELQQLTIDWLLSHRIDAVTNSYFKLHVESLKEQYITCIEDLSIEDTEVRVLESEDKKLLKELQRKVDLLEEADRLRKGREQKLKDLPLLK
jgi:integrase